MDFVEYAAAALQSQGGELRAGARWVEQRAERGELFTFGPFVQLSPGPHLFELEYCYFAGLNCQSRWDVYTPKQGGHVLAQGELKETDGAFRCARGIFVIPQGLGEAPIEVRSYYPGTGSLAIRALRFGHKYRADELMHTSSAKLRGGMVVGQGIGSQPVTITYGPYCLLPQGHYAFELLHASRSDSAIAGDWEIIAGNSCLARGTILNSGGVTRPLRGMFYQTESLTDSTIEMRTFAFRKAILQIFEFSLAGALD